MNESVPREVHLSKVMARLEAAGLLVEHGNRDDASSAGDAQDPVLTGASENSRRVVPGDLFCAWTGTVADGHAYLDAATAAGAVAAVVERPVPDSALPQLVVRDGRRAAGVAAAVVYGDPVDRLKLVGVTGTNGKSTTVWLLRHLLLARYATSSVGTLGVILDDGSSLTGDETLTTPGPVDLMRLLGILADRGTEAAVMEVSSHALDQGRVDACRFDVAVFTNLSRDHLDYHGTLDAYRAAKQRLGNLVRHGGAVVVNADDRAWAGLAESAARALTYGVVSRDAAIRAEDVRLGPSGTRFRLVAPEGSAEVELPLLGEYNVQNALAAAGAAFALDLGLDGIADALSTAPQVPGRLERVVDSPCPVLTDYAHTPDALERALIALRPLCRGRLLVVFGAGGERDPGKRPLMGEVAVRLADVAIVTSDNPRREDPNVIIDQIVAELDPASYLRVSDRHDAIRRALEQAEPRDMILLAGKGHETYQVVGTERIPFDERVVVRELLGARAMGA